MASEPNVETGPEIGKAKAVVILAHGRGGSAADMSALAGRLDRPGIRFISIAAPGGSWYPNSFLAAPESNEPRQSRALAQYEAAVAAALAAGVPLSKLILGGFSQGACLTMGLLWRTPRRYGAALVFTGGLIGPPGTAWEPRPRLAGLPVLLTNGDPDPFVPLSRSEETRRALEASGARVSYHIHQGRPHAICDDELVRARTLLDEVADAP